MRLSGQSEEITRASIIRVLNKRRCVFSSSSRVVGGSGWGAGVCCVVASAPSVRPVCNPARDELPVIRLFLYMSVASSFVAVAGLCCASRSASHGSSASGLTASRAARVVVRAPLGSERAGTQGSGFVCAGSPVCSCLRRERLGQLGAYLLSRDGPTATASACAR